MIITDPIIVNLKDLIGSEHAVSASDGQLLRTVLLHHLEHDQPVVINFHGITTVISAFIVEVAAVICSLKGHRLVRITGMSKEVEDTLRRMPDRLRLRPPELLKEEKPEEPWAEAKQRLEVEVASMVREHNLQIEKLTTKQIIEVLLQALASGDFQRLIDMENGTQKVIYRPGQEAETARAEARMAHEIAQQTMKATAMQIAAWSRGLKRGELTPDKLAGIVTLMGSEHEHLLDEKKEATGD